MLMYSRPRLSAAFSAALGVYSSIRTRPSSARLDLNQLSRWLAGSPTQLVLFENCRNTPPIAASAAQLSSTRMEEVLRRQGPLVDRQFYDSDDELVDLLGGTSALDRSRRCSEPNSSTWAPAV
jgi:hypothetical protein